MAGLRCYYTWVFNMVDGKLPGKLQKTGFSDHFICQSDYVLCAHFHESIVNWERMLY